MPTDNTSGIRGVTWRKDRAKWECNIHVHDIGSTHRRRLLRKLVPDLIEARAVILEARRQFFECSREADTVVLSVHAQLDRSEVNGPGERFVFWAQYCPHACPECFNPQTWSVKGGQQIDVLTFAVEILRIRPDGITISGGEPFKQPAALLRLLQYLHDDKGNLPWFPKGIICFTGYTLEEIHNLPGPDGDAARACLDYIDLLIDGRYIAALRTTTGLCGSSNQHFHFLDRLGRGRIRITSESVLETMDQQVEVHSDPNHPDVFAVTGFPTVNRRLLQTLGLSIVPSVSKISS